jgi:hypothetical protein
MLCRHDPLALDPSGTASPQLLAKLRSWKRVDKPGSTTLIGFANVSVLWGGEWIEADDCPLSASHGKAWVIFPGWPVVTAEGFVARIPGTSKPRYIAKFRWGSQETQRRFSNAIVALVRARDPEAFADREIQP